MPTLGPSDRLVQVKGHPDKWFRLQKSGGQNSRLQHVDLSEGEYRLDGSFLVENSRLTPPMTYSDYSLGGPRSAMAKIEVDEEVYTKIKAYMARLKCETPNEALRQLFKL